MRREKAQKLKSFFQECTNDRFESMYSTSVYNQNYDYSQQQQQIQQRQVYQSPFMQSQQRQSLQQQPMQQRQVYQSPFMQSQQRQSLQQQQQSLFVDDLLDLNSIPVQPIHSIVPNEKESKIHISADSYNELMKENERLRAELDIKIKEINKLQKLSNAQEEKITNLQQLLEDKQKEYQSIDKPSISFEALDMEDIQSLKRIKVLGQGATGKTIEVTKNIEKKYVLKELIRVDFKSFKNFIKEHDLLSYLNHPNIVKTYGIFIGNEENPASILLEYCDTDLNTAMKENKLSKINISFYIYQIAEGMKYVHFKDIIHKDLKPGNILICKNDLVKICDFGTAKLISTEELTSTSDMVGTLFYMAPELLLNQDYNNKVDVFSFGIVVYFLLNEGKVPGATFLMGKRPTIPSSFTEFAKKLVEKCWCIDHESRPSFETICKELEENDYCLFDMSIDEKLLLKNLVNKYKLQIPHY